MKIENNENDHSEKLQNLLVDIKHISVVQDDINNLLNTQEEDLKRIDNKVELTLDNLTDANIHLEKASKYKTLLKPVLIGGSIGVLCSLPISIPICIATSTSVSVIGYSCIGGGIIGGIGAKILS